MAGFASHDGKLSGNRQLVERYDESHGKKSGHLQRPGAGGGESGGAHEISGHDEIKQVVEEHGPAHSSHIHHLGGGRYHVMTHHEDGSVHHADHESLEDAHTHSAIAHDDTEHLGDMPKDDFEVSEEKTGEERDSGRKHERVGFMK